MVNNLVAWAVTTGPRPAEERRHAVATGRPRSGHLERLPRRPARPRESSSTTKRSTSGGTRRTTGFARSPKSSPRWFPTAGSSSPRGPGRTSGAIASIAARSRGSCRRSGRNGRCGEAPIELYEAYRRVGLTLEEFEGARFSRIKYLQSLLASGRLDGDLRWRLPAEDALLTAAG